MKENQQNKGPALGKCEITANFRPHSTIRFHCDITCKWGRNDTTEAISKKGYLTKYCAWNRRVPTNYSTLLKVEMGGEMVKRWGFQHFISCFTNLKYVSATSTLVFLKHQDFKCRQPQSLQPRLACVSSPLENELHCLTPMSRCTGGLSWPARNPCKMITDLWFLQFLTWQGWCVNYFQNEKVRQGNIQQCEPQNVNPRKLGLSW